MRALRGSDVEVVSGSDPAVRAPARQPVSRLPLLIDPGPPPRVLKLPGKKSLGLECCEVIRISPTEQEVHVQCPRKLSFDNAESLALDCGLRRKPIGR